jgi:hypothetical protein
VAKRLVRYFSAFGIAIAAASGCTSQQMYSTGQEWQRNECNRIIDNLERSRCLEKVNTHYEDYKRQREALKKQETR